jgi:hypothetical protein
MKLGCCSHSSIDFLFNDHFEVLASRYSCNCFIAGVNNTGNVVDMGEQLIAGVVDTGDNTKLRISPGIFVQIQNGPNETFKSPGETEP